MKEYTQEQFVSDLSEARAFASKLKLLLESPTRKIHIAERIVSPKASAKNAEIQIDIELPKLSYAKRCENLGHIIIRARQLDSSYGHYGYRARPRIEMRLHVPWNMRSTLRGNVNAKLLRTEMQLSIVDRVSKVENLITAKYNREQAQRNSETECHSYAKDVAGCLRNAGYELDGVNDRCTSFTLHMQPDDKQFSVSFIDDKVVIAQGGLSVQFAFTRQDSADETSNRVLNVADQLLILFRLAQPYRRSYRYEY